MRIAALDLGTNTFLCLIADVERGRISRVLSDQARVVRLGQGVHQNRRFHVEALARADECLHDYATEIRRWSVDKIVASATSAARDVANGNELLELGRRHGIKIEIISGEREAECTFWGTVDDSVSGPVAIIDVGGGSTEFILGDVSSDGTGGIRSKISVDIGSVRMTESFVTKHPIPPNELKTMRKHIEEKFRVVQSQFADMPACHLIAVAGTPTTLAALDMGKPFDAASVQGYRLSRQLLQDWTERLSTMTVQERQHLAGMDAKRADVIVAGSLILGLGCEALRLSELTVSIRGLRYGLARLAEGQQ